MKSKLLYVSLIFLLLLPFSAANATGNKIITISDEITSSTIQKQELTTHSADISEQTGNFVVADAGDSPETAISIPLVPDNETNVGNYSSTLNDTRPFLMLKFQIDEPSYVVLDFNFSEYDIDSQNVFIDILSGPELEYVGGLYDNYFPNSFEYPVDNLGDQFIAIGVDSQIFPFSLFFSLSITQYKQGATQVGIKNEYAQGNANSKLENIYSEFQSENYINDTDIFDIKVNTGRFTENTSSFAKGIALSIIGIIQAAKQLTSGNQYQNDFDTFNAIIFRYSMISYKLFKLVNDTMYNDAIGLYYEPNLSDKINDDYYYSLEDNVYMTFAMVELSYFLVYVNNFLFGIDKYSSYIVDPIPLQNQAYLFADNIINNFYDSGYRNSIFINWTAGTPYTKNSQINSTSIQANTLAFMQELFEQLDIMQFDAGKPYNPKYLNEAYSIMGGLKAMMVNPTSLSLESPGLIAHEYNYTTTSLSDEFNLEDQILLTSAYIPLNGFNQSYSDIVLASTIMSNALSLFTDSTYNLLYTNYNITSKVYVKEFSTIDHTFLIRTLNALTDVWKNKFGNIFINGNPLSEAESDANSRVWAVKSASTSIAFEDLFYDKLTKSFFSSFDAVGHYFITNETQLHFNAFVANSFYLCAITQEFPAEGYIAYQNLVNIDQSALIAVDIVPIFIPIGSDMWFNPAPSFTFTLQVSIAKFGYSESVSQDIGDFFTNNNSDPDTFHSFVYEPTSRGSFTIDISIVSDGRVLLSKKIQMVAYGIVYPSFSGAAPSFATDDDSFTAAITLVDENGIAAPNLKVDASLVVPIEDAPDTYKINSRTDSSGVLSLTFDVSDFANDFINYSKINAMPVRPDNLFFVMFLNVTNAKSFNLRQEDRYIVIPFRVDLSRVIFDVSPSLLEITQGTTETFSFSVVLTNQKTEPISNAKVNYSIDGVEGSNNSVTTDTDGKATISFRDTILLTLQPPEVNITMRIIHEDYPVKFIRYPLNIKENQLQILANPVFISIRGKTLFESSISAFDVEVVTQDLFGQTVVASAWLSWVDTSNNEIINLKNLGAHFTPYSFSIDPSHLPAGDYKILISAHKDGLTTLDSPSTVIRTISITSPTLFESIISAFLIYGIYAIGKLTGVGYTAFMKATGKLTECPLCGEYTPANEKACRYCGNLIKAVDNQQITPPVAADVPAEQPAKLDDSL